MRNVRPVLAIVLLLSVQSWCALAPYRQQTPPATEPPAPTERTEPTEIPTTESPPTPVPETDTPEAESVGTINLVVSQVETGPVDNLQFLEGIQDFHNGDGVRVTQGGKGKLDLIDGSQMTLFNETEVSGVTVTTAPNETNIFLQNQGFAGTVPTDGNTTVHLPSGAAITILGTTFFVIYDEQTEAATVGNFDGSVLFVPPGGTEQALAPGQMVSIPAQGFAVLMGLPFSPEDFEAAVDREGTPTAGLDFLMREFQIEPFPVVEVARMTFANRVRSVAFSPDGRYVIAGGCEELRGECTQGIAHVMDVFNGQIVSSMIHPNAVWSVAFSPDSQYVASGSEDGTIILWNAVTGEEAARMGHTQQVRTLAFSPDGSLLASGSNDDTARVWDAFSGAEVAVMLHDEAGTVVSVDFSPDGISVVSGSYDGTARVWETFSGAEVSRMDHNSTFQGAVTSVAFSPDGRYVVSGGCDDEFDFCSRGSARVWDASSGEEIAYVTDKGFVNSVAFSPDGRYVVNASGQRIAEAVLTGTLVVWEAFTGAEIVHLDLDNWIYEAVFSPDGRYVASASRNGLIEVWDAFGGGLVTQMSHDSEVYALAYSPDGRYIASASEDGTARVWLLQTN